MNNVVKLTGNLGADPKIIETEKNKFAVFSLATSDRYKDKTTDEWKNTETIWHEVVTFKPALIEKMKELKKGQRVEVKGSLSYRAFDTIDKDGNKISKKEASIIANTLEVVLLKERG